MAASRAPGDRGAPRQGSTEAGSSGLSEYEILELREAAGADRRIFRVRLGFNTDNVMKTVSAIHAFAALRDIGTVLKTVPDFEKLYEDAFYPVVEYFVAVDEGPEELRRKASIPDVVDEISIEELLAEPAAKAVPAPAKVPAAPAAPVPQAPFRTLPQAGSQSAIVEEGEPETAIASSEAHRDETRRTSQGSILRVDSRRIDNLLNLVSETVINKATFNQISARFGELMSSLQGSQNRFREGIKDLFDELPDYLSAIQQGKSVKDIKKEILEKYGFLYQVFEGFETDLKNDVAKFRSTAQNLGRITGELQEGVMRIRMVPISQIFSRFPKARAGPHQDAQQKGQPRHRGRGDRARQVRHRGSPRPPYAFGSQRARPWSRIARGARARPERARKGRSCSRPPTKAT